MNYLEIFKIPTLIKKGSQFIDWLDDKRYGSRKELRDLAKRIQRILKSHQIHPTQVNYVFPNSGLQPVDFDSLDSLIKKIDDSFLSDISNKLFINKEWLQTGKGKPQDEIGYNQNYEAILKYLTSLKNIEDKVTIYFFVETGLELTPIKKHSLNDYVVVAAKFHENVNGFEFEPYQLLYTGAWHHTKSRMMIKAISLICYQLQLTQLGHFIDFYKIKNLEQSFVAELYPHIYETWYPEDYTPNIGNSIDRDALMLGEYLKREGLFEKVKNLNQS